MGGAASGYGVGQECGLGRWQKGRKSLGRLRTRTWWCVSHQAGESEPTTRMRPAFRAQSLGAEPRHPELGTRGQVPHRPVVSEVLAGLGPELGHGLETDTPEPVVLDTLCSGVPKAPFSPFSPVSAPREQEDGGADPTCPVHCRVNAFTNFEWGEKKRLPCRHPTCTSLTLHDLPPTPKATSCPFYRCGSLTQLTCPSSLSVQRSPGPVVPVPPPHLWKGFLQGNILLGVPLGRARFLPTSPRTRSAACTPPSRAPPASPGLSSGAACNTPLLAELPGRAPPASAPVSLP